MRSGMKRLKAWMVMVALLIVGTLPVWGQSAPPPKPKPRSEAELQDKKPPPKPKQTGPVKVYIPPPVLLLSADMACSVELDGEELVTLEKDVVQELRIKPGDHLLQAFPLDVDSGPTWKQTVKAPDTGKVVATIELRALVEKWEKDMQNVDRFSEQEKTIADSETGLLWTRSVSPAMRWSDAAGYCQRQRAAGQGGWRLPTLDDLSKLHFPDHPSPRQETARTDASWSLLGRRKGEMQVLPRLIFEPFDHNSVSSLWVASRGDRVSCSFLGEFNCTVEGKKHKAGLFCVRSLDGGASRQ